MKYPSIRVVRAGELEPGEVLHCGKFGIHCAEWHVVSADIRMAVFRVGTAYYSATSREIRELEMYRAKDCPFCDIDASSSQPAPEQKIPDYRVERLEAADVASQLGKLDMSRGGPKKSTGGATYRTEADLARAERAYQEQVKKKGS
jgi:hypothetical protein